jgi:hypothetical protein
MPPRVGLQVHTLCACPMWRVLLWKAKDGRWVYRTRTAFAPSIEGFENPPCDDFEWLCIEHRVIQILGSGHSELMEIDTNIATMWNWERQRTTRNTVHCPNHLNPRIQPLSPAARIDSDNLLLIASFLSVMIQCGPIGFPVRPHIVNFHRIYVKRTDRLCITK